MILCHVHGKIFSFRVSFLDVKDHFTELVRLEKISVLTKSKIHSGFLRFLCAGLISLLSSLPRRCWDEALGSQREQGSWFFWILIVFSSSAFTCAPKTQIFVFLSKSEDALWSVWFFLFQDLQVLWLGNIWTFFFFCCCEEKRWERESLLDFFFQNTAKTLGFWAWQFYSNLIK